MGTIDKSDFYEYFKKNRGIEFSKEEIINIFSKSSKDEVEIERFLSEMEVESTYSPSNLFVTCKAGTVYYKWNEST
ncbi:MAG TPA: hypothetical protein VER14_00130 [Phototrophicaceae bacterium]|nr:hypothetical protein [Phototrophicaceae bacterium]